MRSLAALICLAALAGPVQAGDEVVTLLREARELASAGDHARALSVYEEVLPRVAAELGAESAAVAVLYGELARQHEELGQLTEAEDLYRRSLAIGEGVHGPEHLSVAISLTRLAGLSEKQARLAEARSTAARARAILEAECGPRDEDAAGARDPDQACEAALRSHRQLMERLDAAPVATSRRKSAAPARVYRVQLASRQDRARAEQELGSLREALPSLAGLPAHIESVELGERGVWHRVQFGRFTAREDADALCAVLREEGQADCLVASTAP